MSVNSTCTFTNGPISGRTLPCDRTPIMVRVGMIAGKDPRLMVLADSLDPGETAHAYIMHGHPSTGFWDGRDLQTGRRTGGQFSHAQYRSLTEQPAQSEMQNGSSWSDWCDANKDRLMAEYKKSIDKSA